MIYHNLSYTQNQILKYFMTPSFYKKTYDIPKSSVTQTGFTLTYPDYAFSVNKTRNFLDKSSFKLKFIYKHIIICQNCSSNPEADIYELVEFKNGLFNSKTFFCQHNTPYIINFLSFLVET